MGDVKNPTVSLGKEEIEFIVKDTSISQKVALIECGISLSVVIREIGLRISGSVYP